MKLSKHFTLEELTHSSTAAEEGIDNTPDAAGIEKLKLLCEKVLEPIRVQFGPIRVNSGYRSDALNKAIGGALTSQHSFCEAADVSSRHYTPLEIAEWCIANLPAFGQVIREPSWTHVSYDMRQPCRNQPLSMDRVNGKPHYSKGINPPK